MFLFQQHQTLQVVFFNGSKKRFIYLDVSFEQASKFIVSAGTTNIN